MALNRNVLRTLSSVERGGGAGVKGGEPSTTTDKPANRLKSTMLVRFVELISKLERF